MQNAEELLTWVDMNDAVLGQATKEEVYAKYLPHRIVHVHVYDGNNRVLLQQRSKNKDYLPLYWCTAACGHVRTGESYEQAASRELREELGIESPLEFVAKDCFEVSGMNLRKFIGFFSTCHAGPFRINNEEVEKAEFFTWDDVEKMLLRKEKMHPELEFLFKKHFLNKNDRQHH